MDWTIAGVILSGLAAIGAAWGVLHKTTGDLRKEFSETIKENEQRWEAATVERAHLRDAQFRDLKDDQSKIWTELASVRGSAEAMRHFEKRFDSLERSIENIGSRLDKAIDSRGAR